jgi:hypothetical protein
MSKKKKKKQKSVPEVDPHFGAVTEDRSNYNYVLSVIADLLAGKTVINYKEGGTSMEPKIRNGQLQTLVPISDLGTIKKKDIVLCKVHGKIYTHLVKSRRFRDGKWEFSIGNNHGHTNGWTFEVYGKSVARYWKKLEKRA